MEPAALEELVESIRRDGQQRPVKVRPHPESTSRFELVFGHRTVSALNKAGLEMAQAIVEKLDDEEVMWAQYAENEYREEVSDYDRARWLKTMIETYGYTQRELAEKLSLDNSWVSHHLSMLKLKGALRRDVLSKLSEFQARTILSTSEETLTQVCKEIEQYYRENEDLPSASTIADIISYVASLHRLEEIRQSHTGQVASKQAPSIEADESKDFGREGELEAESCEESISDEDQLTEPSLPDPEEYIAEYFHRHLKPDEEFLAWDLERKYGITEEEARRLIRNFRDSREQRHPKKGPHKSSVHTTRCPLCGRDGADKNMILMRVEDPVTSQKTLEQYINEALRR